MEEKRCYLIFFLLLLLAVIIVPSPPTADADEGRGAYVIGGGDVLEVNVWKNPQLSRVVTVRPDGMITLPLVGDVRAESSTSVELGALITERVAAFVNGPNVTVTVQAAKNYRVYTQGAVSSIGVFSLLEPMPVNQFLSLAGGPVEGADLAGAFIMRGKVKIPVSLLPDPDAVQIAQGIRVRPGDVLVIPFLGKELRVLVVGKVGSPKGIPFREGMTVLDAFIEVGGGGEFARLNKVKVIRGSGKEKRVITVDLNKVIKKGDLRHNILLQPGDIVSVP